VPRPNRSRIRRYPRPIDTTETSKDETLRPDPELGAEIRLDPTELPLPARMTPRKGPALVIIGIVAFITIGGGLLATLGAGPKVGAGTIKSPPGLDLPADPAAKDLAVITSEGQPPADIVEALVVPAGAVPVDHALPGGNDSLYDGSITLDVPATVKTSLAFYTYELRHDGWAISETVGGPDGGTDIYARHNSNDGYTWEVGVLVGETNGAITPALDGGNAPAETSSVELRIIENDDPD
jgi:hypothetical protein